MRDWMQVNVWDAIGWKAKQEPKKAPKSSTGETNGAAPEGGADGLRASCSAGGVVGIHTEEEWEAALALTKESELVVVVDFTAVWCGPCQKIAPFYGSLAGKHAGSALFVKVDVDELEDIAQNAGVAAMPTFQVYKNGKLVDTCTGAREAALEAMVAKATS